MRQHTRIRTRGRSAWPVMAFALLAVGCAQPDTPAVDSAPEGGYADSVFHNGRIYTVDNDRSWAEAVAIRDGRYLATGSDEAVLGLAGPETVRHDLAGAMALPGLHDAHFHGMAIYNSLDCSPPFFTPAQLREILEYCVTQRVDGHPWLVINNLQLWDESETVTNAVLNEVVPDIPVMIRDTSGHMRLVNAMALDAAGIDSDTPDPDGGLFLRHPDTGEPTGVLVEPAAISPVSVLIPPYPDEALEQARADLVEELFSFGITSLQDAFASDLGLLTRLGDADRQGQPMPYMMLHLGWSYPEGETRRQEEALIRDRDRFETPHVSVTGIKVFLDGVPVPPAFTHVPLNEDGSVDETHLLVPRDALAGKLIEWDRAGLTVKMHASAQGAVRVGLDAIEATRSANGDSGVWHEIAHAGNIHDDDIPRFAALEAVAEVSPYFWHEGPFSQDPAAYRFRTLQDAGAMITLGSDNIVLPSFNPFPPLEGVVTRQGQSVPVGTAIDYYTRNPAEVLGRLDDMGSIEPGKIANMIVLDRNLFEIAPADIGDTLVQLTVLDGEVVYRRQ